MTISVQIPSIVEPHDVRSRAVSLLRAVAAYVLLLAAGAAGAAGTRCAGGDFIAVDTSPSETEIICAAAKEVVGFAEAHGLRATRSITTIHIVDKLTQLHFSSSIGSYDAKRDRIEVLSYKAAVKLIPERPAFGVPMSRALYRSFIVHELAHAVANPNFSRPPVPAAHEYIAYTMQLASMPDELRKEILRNVDTEGFDHPREIGELLLAADPNRFAVKAYLHFIRPGNGAMSFEQLLTGQY